MKKIGLPKIGIRPVIDGRRMGVRESLEEQTLNMANATAALLTEKLRHPNGEQIECVIADGCIAGMAESAACEEKFSSQNVGVTITVTPCWCYGSETIDMDPMRPKAIWGFNGTERPGAVYLAAALAAITFAVQKFVGTPFASSASLRYAQGLIGEYRKAKSSGTLDEFMAAAGKSENRNSEAKTASKRITLAEKFDGFYSSNVCILLAVVGGLLSVWLGELTHINYAILGLVLGVIFTQLGVVPKNLLQKAQASGFINMVVFAAIIPALANISISDLIDLILPLVVVFAVSVLSIFVMMKVLPVWKILGDKSMAFGVGFCQMLGFPSTYLISVEVCNAVAEDEDEKAFLMSRVMPRLVVGGMAAMVSILVAGVMAGML